MMGKRTAGARVCFFFLLAFDHSCFKSVSYESCDFFRSTMPSKVESATLIFVSCSLHPACAVNKAQPCILRVTVRRGVTDREGRDSSAQ